jgi:TRAP-type C4-dicarboxylate transport system permease small subunit
MGRVLTSVSACLDRFCREAAMACLTAMVVLISIQVVARYLLSAPPSWTEEGARYAMVWGGFLGATLAFYRGADPTLTSRSLWSDGRAKWLGFLFRTGAVLLFLAPIWYYSFLDSNADPSRGFLARTAERTTESLGLSLVWFTAALPFAITVIFIHILAQAASGAVDRSQTGEEAL